MSLDIVEVEMGSSCTKSCCERRNSTNLCEVNENNLSMVIEQLGVSELSDRDPSVTSEQLDASDFCELNDRDLSVASERSDICGMKESKFIIQSGIHFVELDSLADDIPITNIKPLKEKCKNGDHYLALYAGVYRPKTKASPAGSGRMKKNFYVIKGTSCIVVGSLDTEGETRGIFSLHPDCQGGSHYLARKDNFYIIRREDNTYLCVSDMSKDRYNRHTANRYKLHKSYANGLHYFATDYYFYILKENPGFGLVYHRTKDLRSNKGESVIDVSPSIANFLRGSTPFEHQTTEGMYRTHRQQKRGHPLPHFLLAIMSR